MQGCNLPCRILAQKRPTGHAKDVRKRLVFAVGRKREERQRQRAVLLTPEHVSQLVAGAGEALEARVKRVWPKGVKQPLPMEAHVFGDDQRIETVGLREI